MIKFIDALEIFSKNALNHYEKMPEQTPYKQNFFFGSITMCKTYDGAVTINFKLKGLINPEVDQDLLGAMLMTANEQGKVLREVDEICVYTVKNNYMTNKTTLYQKGDYSYILIKKFFLWSMKNPQSPLRARSLTEALRNSLMLGGDRRRPTEEIPGSSSRASHRAQIGCESPKVRTKPTDEFHQTCKSKNGDSEPRNLLECGRSHV
ncbi:hypothetical protein PVAND_014999 [Polypedilum vanderplanki]|uniref:Uncharacterized protein n=1 Tax=Polypedilum vanderplanki TaxID=319348 RepID=A0A9J6BAY8_POLVA|nr:hypothetical protein PVAND_014999 [Polypedilum vanderplanki]